jgi:hypothetical protein
MKHIRTKVLTVGILFVALPLLAIILTTHGTTDKVHWWFVNGAGATLATGTNQGKVVGFYDDVNPNTDQEEYGYSTKNDGKNIKALQFPGSCSTEVWGTSGQVDVGIYERYQGPGRCGGNFLNDIVFTKEGDDFSSVLLPNTAIFFTEDETLCSDDGGVFTEDDTFGDYCAVTTGNRPDGRGVNKEETVVGGFSPGGDLGFVFTEKGKFTVLEACTDLENLTEGCRHGTTDAWGINNKKWGKGPQVVGHFEDKNATNCETGETGPCGFHRGFIWTKKDGFTPYACDGDVLTNTDLNGISDRGIAVGRCDSEAAVFKPPYRDQDWHKFKIPEDALQCPNGSGLNATVAYGIEDYNDDIVGAYTCDDSNETTIAFRIKLKDINFD